MIDAEHGSMDIETAGRMVSVIRGTDATPLIRVAENDKSWVKGAWIQAQRVSWFQW